MLQRRMGMVGRVEWEMLQSGMTGYYRQFEIDEGCTGYSGRSR